MHFLTIIALCTCLFQSIAFAEQTVRLAILRGQEAKLTGTNLQVVAANNQEICAGDTLELQVKSGSIRCNGRDSSSQILFIKSPGLIRAGGHSYRNGLEALWQKGTLLLIHELPLETYVAGIIGGEMPKGWPLESYKAQAIVARTYAIVQKYRRINEPFHLETTIMDQVYAGTEREHDLATLATQETFGQILTYNSKPINAYFFSACGGKTESALDGWGKSANYLPGSSCGFCDGAKYYKWSYSLTRHELEKALKGQIKGHIKDVEIAKKSASGRAKTICVTTNKGRYNIDGAHFRKAIGYMQLKSTLITDIDFNHTGVTFTGKGFGHGVGMCQWGAFGMANKGYTALDILEKYYPKTELRRMY